MNEKAVELRHQRDLNPQRSSSTNTQPFSKLASLVKCLSVDLC